MGEYNYDRLLVDLHPDDAVARQVVSGDPVRVFNDLGTVECVARVTNRVRSGVVSMPKGAWRRTSKNGSTSTALCPDHVNIVGGAACFNDARVEVEKL
jgi:anaerobic selenocysteine-containing dehydrogenase